MGQIRHGRATAAPANGVVNACGQAHDIDNPFVSAGRQFTSSAACKLTLIIVALAIRQASGEATSRTR